MEYYVTIVLEMTDRQTDKQTDRLRQGEAETEFMNKGILQNTVLYASQRLHPPQHVPFSGTPEVTLSG